MDLGFAPQRHVVGLGRREMETRALLGLEVLTRQPPRGAVASHSVLVEAPLPCVLAGTLDIERLLAAETILRDHTYRTLDAGLVRGLPHPRRVDHEAACLCVLEKPEVNHRLEGIGLLHHGRGVVGDQDVEDPAVEGPRRLAGLDGRFRRLPGNRVHEPIARDAGREDPGPETLPASGQIPLEPADPARVELDLLARLAIRDRYRGGALAEAKLRDGVTPQRRIAF